MIVIGVVRLPFLSPRPALVLTNTKVIAYWLTFGTRYINSSLSWRLPFGLQLIPGVILFFGAWFLPYSPRWLAMQKRYDECLASLARLRSLPEHDPRVQAEHLTILAEVAVNKEVAALRHPSLDSDNLGSKTSLWQAIVRETKEYRLKVGVGARCSSFWNFLLLNLADA